MSRRRAEVTLENTQKALGSKDLLDHLLRHEGLAGEVIIQEVAIDKIDPNPYQPRQHFEEEKLKELASSIEQHGFYGHLVARRVGGRYQLAYGERRMRAARLAGSAALPLDIRELTDEQMLEISLTENVQREDLTPMEEAAAYAQLRDRLELSIRDIAAKVGKSKSYVATLLRVLDTPDVAEAVTRADIPIRTAEELAKVEDQNIRQDLIAQVIKGALGRGGVRQARTVRSADTFRPLMLLKAAETKLSTLNTAMLEHTRDEEIEGVVDLLNRIVRIAEDLLSHLGRR